MWNKRRDEEPPRPFIPPGPPGPAPVAPSYRRTEEGGYTRVQYAPGKIRAGEPWQARPPLERPSRSSARSTAKKICSSTATSKARWKPSSTSSPSDRTAPFMPASRRARSWPSGPIQGNVEATERIEIRKDAKLVGDIRTARIIIEDGAYFKGSIDIVKPEPAKAQRPAAGCLQLPATASGGGACRSGRRARSSARVKSTATARTAEEFVSRIVAKLWRGARNGSGSERLPHARTAFPSRNAAETMLRPTRTESRAGGILHSHPRPVGPHNPRPRRRHPAERQLHHQPRPPPLFRRFPADSAARRSAAKTRWTQSNPGRIEYFLRQALDYPEGQFDGVLVWDVLEYLAPALLTAVVERLHKIVRPKSYMLAFFHSDDQTGGGPVLHLPHSGSELPAGGAVRDRIVRRSCSIIGVWRSCSADSNRSSSSSPANACAKSSSRSEGGEVIAASQCSIRAA